MSAAIKYQERLYNATANMDHEPPKITINHQARNRRIAKLRSNGVTYQRIAEWYGISRVRIYQIVEAQKLSA